MLILELFLRLGTDIQKVTLELTKPEAKSFLAKLKEIEKVTTIIK